MLILNCSYSPVQFKFVIIIFKKLSSFSSLWFGVSGHCTLFEDAGMKYLDHKPHEQQPLRRYSVLSPSHWVLTAVSTALSSHCSVACSVALQPAAREMTWVWVTARRTPSGSLCHNSIWFAQCHCFPELQDKSAGKEADHQPVLFFPGPQQTRSNPMLSATGAIPSASSPSDLLPGGQIPALHLREWSSARRQRAICIKDWISFDSAQKSKKDSFWMRW